MLRSELCYLISRRMMRTATGASANADGYADWRTEEMLRSWSNFSDDDITGRDVLDFGCGEGPLSIHLARKTAPHSILGVDIDQQAISRAKRALAAEDRVLPVRFELGGVSRVPVGDECVDTVLAFDCMEHVMDPAAIIAEWHRVLRPGGKVLIDWCPFMGPYGPHMTGLVPIPWAHVIFGERAMFETAARIYDDPAYPADHWDRDEAGGKRPNRWAQWTSFREQGYLNELSISGFRRLVEESGFAIMRQEKRGFGDGGIKGAVGAVLVNLPLISEYFVSYALIELRKPAPTTP